MIRKTTLFLVLLGLTDISVIAGQVHTNLTDLGAVKLTLSGNTYFGLGTDVTGVGDFNGDGFREVAIGAPSYDPGGFGNGYNNGAVFLVSGKELDRTRGEIDLSTEEYEGFVVYGKIESKIGNSLAYVGDINVDGFCDLAFGSENHYGGYIIYGRGLLERYISLTDETDDCLEILNTGFCVSSAGDFNGDGFPDAVFGNPYSELIDVKGKEFHIGSVTLLYGNSFLPTSFDAMIPNQHLKSIPGPAGAEVGKSISGGYDMNCDGFSDILVVAPKGGKNFQGRTLLIYGSEELGENVEYTFIIDHAKRYVRPTQDVNGDGFPDLLVGGNDGSVYLVWGGKHLKGTLKIQDHFDSNWGTKLIPGDPKWSLSAYGIGDLNGDGFGDIAVSIPQASVGDKILAGRVVFLFGRPQWPETIDVRGLSNGDFSVMDFVIVDGLDAFGVFGSAIAGIGDIQGDGFDDVLIGAPMERVPGESIIESSGSAYVIQGQNLFLSLQSYQSNFFSQRDIPTRK